MFSFVLNGFDLFGFVQSVFHSDTVVLYSEYLTLKLQLFRKERESELPQM